MQRKDFLKGLSGLGIVSLIPLSKALSSTDKADGSEGGCVMTPEETAGPFPNLEDIVRQDITEGVPGTPLIVTFTIQDAACIPIPNARVDVWHCSKDGVYSEYASMGTLNDDWLRGIQYTDANGQCMFVTIYPGWYPGRTTHIHFEVFYNGNSVLISQFAFPEDVTTEVYNNTALYTNGQKDMSNASDGVFQPSSDLIYEMLTVVPNSSIGGYDGTITVVVDAPTGINNLQPETGGQFVLQQNTPNPFSDMTTIKFSLVQRSKVKLVVYDMQGRFVTILTDDYLNAGNHAVEWNRTSQGTSVANGNYIFRMTTENFAGRFSQTKVMTLK